MNKNSLQNIVLIIVCCVSLICIINQRSLAQQNPLVVLQDVPPTFNRSSIVFSPDGNRIIITAGMIGPEGKDATVWNTNTGEILLNLDHSELVTGNYSGQPLQGRGYVDSAAFSPDGKYIVTGAAPLIATLWNAQTGERIRSFQLEKDNLMIPSQTAFAAVGFAPDGKQLVTSAILPETHLWDVETGKHLRFLFQKGGAEKVKILQDYNRVILIGENTFLVYSFESGQLLFRRDGWIPTLSPDDKYAYTHLGDEGIHKYDMATGELVSVNQNAPFPDILRKERPEIAIAPNGEFVIHGKEEALPHPTRLYGENSTSETSLRTFIPAGYASGEVPLPKDIVISPDSQKVAIQYSDNQVIIYDLSDLETAVPNAPLYDN